MIEQLTLFFKKISKFQKKVFSWIFLQVIYFIGIGLPSLCGKIFQVQYLDQKNKKTTWKSHPTQIDLDTMF